MKHHVALRARPVASTTNMQALASVLRSHTYARAVCVYARASHGAACSGPAIGGSHAGYFYTPSAQGAPELSRKESKQKVCFM